MGHTLLGVLPSTRMWRDVVDLLDSGAATDIVISASALAAERDMRAAANDPVFVEAVRLLAAIPIAARESAFGHALRDAGVPVGDKLGVLDLVTATGDRLDRLAQQSVQTTDFSELTRRALLSTLSESIGERLPGFFEATPEEVRASSARMATPSEFSRLARRYFTELVQRTLGYWLDRTLSAQVGAERRFDGVGDRTSFDGALQQYCLEATRIISEFSAGWYGRRVHRDLPISTQEAAGFGAVALKKVGSELRRKRGADE